KWCNGTDKCTKQRHQTHRTVRIIDQNDDDDEEEGNGRPCKKSPASDEDERFSLEDMLTTPQGGCFSQPGGLSNGQQKHVTLDVRFADFVDSDASLPPPSQERLSMSARNSTTGSECLFTTARSVRNHSLCEDMGSAKQCLYKSISAGHSQPLTPSRCGSFSAGVSRLNTDSEEPLLHTEICCYSCYSSCVGRPRDLNADSPSSDEQARKRYNNRRLSSGTQSFSEPQYEVNLVSNSRCLILTQTILPNYEYYANAH
ncbi:hypothetical protein Ciccas_011893, partial [Cichlidogyrus casuarinus]